MKQRLKVAVSLAVTAFFLWLALRGVEWREVATQLREANWLYLVLAAVIGTLGVHVRALRMKTLLAPVDPHVAFRPRVAGAAVGLAANNLIPARVGEVVRAVVTARLAKLPVSAVFAALVVERVLDGVITVALLFGVMALPGFPDPERAQGALTAVRIVALVMAVIGIVLIAMALLPRHSARLAEATVGRVLPERLRAPFLARLDEFIAGLAVLRNPGLLVLSVGWAVGQWLFITLSIWLAFLAFGIHEPGYVGALFLQCAINLAVAVPAAPGFFGPLEAAAAFGLGLWGVEKARAVSFAIGWHLGGYIGVTVLGLWYAQRLGLSWGELVGSAGKAEAKAGAGADPALVSEDERRA